MKLTDPALVDLIRAKHAEGQDLLLMRASPFLEDDAISLADALNKRLLVLLPGVFYPLRQSPEGLYLQEDSVLPDCLPGGASVCWADIRLLKQERFRVFLRRAAFYEWILPFADCAEPTEPGYLGSYTLPLDLRSELSAETGITAMFSYVPSDRLTDACFDLRRTVVLNANAGMEAQSLFAENESVRLRAIRRMCTKRMLSRTAVIFPTRRQADAFASDFSPGNVSLVHGGRSREENLSALARFSEGRSTVLAATKHVLTSASFFQADEVLFCGVPASVSLLARCGAFSADPDAPCLCIYTPQDLALNRRLARSCAAALGFGEKAFCARRDRLLSQTTELLQIQW